LVSNKTKEVGDLVASYLTNTSEYDTLLEVGLVLEVNEEQRNLLVLTRAGHKLWWNENSWRLMQKK